MKINSLSFREFMARALYEEKKGYYSSGRNPIGGGGDYVTSPHISPLFAWCLARLVEEFVARIGDEVCAIVDIGCGDGRLIRQIEALLLEDTRRRAKLYGVDRSLSRITSEAVGGGIGFRESLSDLPKGQPSLLLSNELFDAFPVARLVQREDGLKELWVRDGLMWEEREAPSEYAGYFVERGISLRPGQYADVALEWGSYYRSMCEISDRAMIVTIDYGFDDRGLFDVRSHRWGTVGAFSRQTVSRDVLNNPGLQDLTASVNFSDLIRAGEEAGYETLGFTRQAKFLLSLGALEHPLLAPRDLDSEGSAESILEESDRRAAAKSLILPEGIGEEMRVLSQVRGVPTHGWKFQNSVF